MDGGVSSASKTSNPSTPPLTDELKKRKEALRANLIRESDVAALKATLRKEGVKYDSKISKEEAADLIIAHQYGSK
jgi:K+-transporting ATPase c subunit